MNYKINNITLINGIANNEKAKRSRQMLLEHVDFSWHSINECYLLESESQTGGNVGRFNKVLFDYTTKHSPFAIVLISERCKTTDFEESFSIN